jgi:YD repeat-containing protein
MFLATTGAVNWDYTEWNHTGLKRYDLHGRVKSVHQITYKAGGESGAVAKGAKIDSADLYLKFDVKGNIIERGLNGAKTTYNYNPRGQVTDAKTYKGTALIQTIAFNYDTHGNLTDETSKDAGGPQIEKMSYKYDASKKIIEVRKNTRAGDAWITYRYDSKGNATETDCYLFNSEDGRHTHKYDDKGNVTATTRELQNGENAKTVFKYLYDAKDNYTSKTVLNSSSQGGIIPELKPVLLIERAIEYY